jgi:hypothetical protein
MRIQINFCKSKRFHDLIFNNKKYDKVFELLEVGALVLATGTPYTKIYNNKAELKMYANNLLVLGSKNFMNNDDQMTDQYEDINFDGSSIYLCEGQDIPLELASKNLTSFGVTVGAAFNSALQIPDPILTTPDQSPSSADKLG